MRSRLIQGLAVGTTLFLASHNSLAGPVDDAQRTLEEDAASLLIAPVVAAEIAKALGDAFVQRGAATAGADAPTDRALFVGPRRAWIVLAERRRLEAAEQAYADYRAAGLDVALLKLRDGGYEIALWPRPVGQARKALKRWRDRAAGGADAPRLSDGAGYLIRLTPVWSK